MKIPKAITHELAKRGWTICEGETWRSARGKSWACAYHYYRKKCCLITIAGINTNTHAPEYYIQVLYPIPVCSEYVYSRNAGFNVKLK